MSSSLSRGVTVNCRPQALLINPQVHFTWSRLLPEISLLLFSRWIFMYVVGVAVTFSLCPVFTETAPRGLCVDLLKCGALFKSLSHLTYDKEEVII